MRHFILTILALFVLILAVSAQRTPDFQTVKTEKGMAVFNYNQAQAFSFLVAGNNPEGKQNDDGSLLIKTDSGALYVYFAKTSDFLDKKKTYNELETLNAHRDQDILTQEKALQVKFDVDVKSESFIKVFNLTNNVFPTKLINTVYWSYKTPNSDNPGRALYQTVLIGDLILMLGTVFDQSVKTAEVQDFFKQTLESITLLPPQKQEVKPKRKRSKEKGKERLIPYLKKFRLIVIIFSPSIRLISFQARRYSAVSALLLQVSKPFLRR